VFYVKDRYGMQVTKKAEIERVRTRLLAVLEAPKAKPRAKPNLTNAAAE